MTVLPFDVPVDPEPPEARDWLIDELAKPEYQAAQPTLFDRISQAIRDWFASLQLADVEGPPAFGLTIVLVLVAAVVVVAFLIFGLPRFNRRSAVAGTLFGDDDDRDAEAMRRAAQAAAAAGDHALATAEIFRALARGLAERGLVSTTPGTTAYGFAEHAGRVFPDAATDLAAAAVSFDDVRYLGRPGTPERYAELAALESRLRTARPRLQAAPA
ncbi:MAG TPA: DUF4129 domain-containing protein [Rhodoglobus sp.]|nr:DUF4129 domain-containing protein [Rhodoglobus sp.]